MRRLEALDDLIIAKTGQHAGKTEVELDLARAIVREQDYEAAKAAYLTLKWVLQELETLDYWPLLMVDEKSLDNPFHSTFVCSDAFL